MNWMIRVMDAFVDGLVGTYSATGRGVSLFRILFGVCFILTIGPRFLWATEYPDLFYSPPLPITLLDCTGTVQLGLLCGFPPDWVMLGLEAGGALAAVFLLFGYRTFYASILLTAFLITLNAFRYSFGKIDHDILFVITPAILAFSGWGNHFSIDAKQGRPNEWSYPSYSLFVLALAVGAGFLSAGFPKAINWVDFDLSTSGVRAWVVSSHFGQGGWLTPLFAHTSNVWFWEGMDYAAVLFEVGLALSVLHGAVFRRFLVLAVFFHITNYLMLDIGFILHFPVYAAFLPWGDIAERVKTERLADIIQGGVRYWHLALFTILYALFYFADPLAGLSYVGTAKTLAFYGVSLLVVGWLVIREVKRGRRPLLDTVVS